MKDLESELKALIDMALLEDGDVDVTSVALFDEPIEKEAVIVAKQSGIVCGLSFVEQILKSVDENMLFEAFVAEGDPIKERMMLGIVSGELKSLLKVERVLLNFVSRLSGIATATHELVQEVQDVGGVILDTRKTVPGWRFLDKYAVKIGGGVNHRMGLSDVAMIKDTHIDAFGRVDKVIEKFRENNADAPLIVEVRNIKELNKALNHVKTLNRIILDNFSLQEMEEAVELASGRILLEASGSISLKNARDIAETGVHFLSVGALTHSVKSFDWSFQISE